MGGAERRDLEGGGVNNVLYLKTRKPKEVKRTGVYECLSCRRDFFRIMEDGNIECYTCGKTMSNLEVVKK
jgi:DNA-directed RNA polymerase subunit RPC12/RpoP